MTEKTVEISELKAHCLRLVDEVARRRRELVVTKRGKPIARIVPLQELDEDDALVRLRGTVLGGDRVEDFDIDSPGPNPLSRAPGRGAGRPGG